MILRILNRILDGLQLLGKVCYMIVALYPTVWLFLPRRIRHPLKESAA